MKNAWLICDRCDSDLTDDVVRALEDGGVSECSHCGLALPTPPSQWLEENGYEVGGDD